MVLESEPAPVEEPVITAENIGQDQTSSDAPVIENIEATVNVETKPDEAAIEKPAESVGENVEQPKAPAEVEAKPEAAAAAEGEDKNKDSIEKAAEAAGSETEIETDIESDFDIMEEIDPSYEIDASLWTKVADIDECDLKPEKKDKAENDNKDKEKEEKKKKKEEEADAEEDSGFSEITIRSEKDRDQEFQEYIRELCRPSIVSYLPDRVAPKGSNVRVTCTVQGNNVQTRWMKNDVLLERGKKVQTRSDGEIHSLEITDITEREAGTYTAFFKNRAGEVETSTRITVFDGKLHKPDHIDIALVKGEFKLHSLTMIVKRRRLFLFAHFAKFINRRTQFNSLAMKHFS